MSALLWLLAGFAGALVLALALCGLVIRLGVVDAPTEARKAQIQKRTVPTSGGVGFAAASILAAAMIAALAEWDLGYAVFGVAIGGIAAMVLGLLDDRKAVPARVKLILMVVIA